MTLIERTMHHGSSSIASARRPNTRELLPVIVDLRQAMDYVLKLNRPFEFLDCGSYAGDHHGS